MPFGCIFTKSGGVCGGADGYIYALEHNHHETIRKSGLISLIALFVLTKSAPSLHSLVCPSSAAPSLSPSLVKLKKGLTKVKGKRHDLCPVTIYYLLDQLVVTLGLFHVIF